MLDSYTIVARVLPALLASLPLLIPFAAIYSRQEASLGGVLASAVWLAVAVTLSQIVRSRGKAVEKELFVKWGGAPTTVRLRHRGPSLPKDVVAFHGRLRRLLPGFGLPSAADEAAAAQQADEVYAQAVTMLRARTRDHKRYPLVFKENRDYGFRRNVFALKSAGIIVTLVALIVQVTLIALQGLSWLSPSTFLPTAVALAALGFWTIVCTADWVREAADEYAQQLLTLLLDEASLNDTARAVTSA